MTLDIFKDLNRKDALKAISASALSGLALNTPLSASLNPIKKTSSGPNVVLISNAYEWET
jgi:hypothetical protein